MRQSDRTPGVRRGTRKGREGIHHGLLPPLPAAAVCVSAIGGSDADEGCRRILHVGAGGPAGGDHRRVDEGRLLPGGTRPGAALFAGLYRASPGASELLAWSPNFAGGFHDTSRLGELVLE